MLQINKRKNSPTSRKLNKIQLFEEQNGLCKECHNPLDFSVTDHIKPLGLGGSDNYDNLQLLCILCNMKKTEKDLQDIWNQRKSKGGSA